MQNNNKIHHSFGFAFSGIYYAFRDNRNLKIHLFLAILIIAASFLLGLSNIEKIIALVMIVLVFSAEMVNTALEEMTDLITNEHREEAKRAKDVAAGMVLVTAIGAIIVGIVIFAPYIIELLE
ncbi:MAG: hypothetical protein A3C30_05295 [Candidatus Levybacteria bacterium RIFCSPHIGHO2_02_FULL_40_18]|nr:MAG: hypothetical protein A2869_02955 [Candidatus Levybacteria bacterium RIFCSPHIGHO2_01_FULL_40_58]OGH26490.1 MAG: hypothetical protein A3C30_05295 [Candidatus Levybacteria bacterium RIFCSPHIGHO2_02_FULL_40_18]OGH31938.1 MAG: hypothetical protein A3E43_01095 [Candidatus Levybacteria bacterium RIFCSPHIGHO2_12_FULL_40_31]OGH40207.1 MAG: hypothetical protein A2894_05190 [Candidatus Levybacteria bacterium RIFCSPLOWO2_01_FULL_40_64]OGH49331.1 MAG: hypothetical protein A3I54_01640 [Candidatus Lev